MNGKEDEYKFVPPPPVTIGDDKKTASSLDNLAKALREKEEKAAKEIAETPQPAKVEPPRPAVEAPVEPQKIEETAPKPSEKKLEEDKVKPEPPRPAPAPVPPSVGTSQQSSPDSLVDKKSDVDVAATQNSIPSPTPPPPENSEAKITEVPTHEPKQEEKTRGMPVKESVNEDLFDAIASELKEMAKEKVDSLKKAASEWKDKILQTIKLKTIDKWELVRETRSRNVLIGLKEKEIERIRAKIEVTERQKNSLKAGLGAEMGEFDRAMSQITDLNLQAIFEKTKGARTAAYNPEALNRETEASQALIAQRTAEIATYERQVAEIEKRFSDKVDVCIDAIKTRYSYDALKQEAAALESQLKQTEQILLSYREKMREYATALTFLQTKGSEAYAEVNALFEELKKENATYEKNYRLLWSARDAIRLKINDAEREFGEWRKFRAEFIKTPRVSEFLSRTPPDQSAPVNAPKETMPENAEQQNAPMEAPAFYRKLNESIGNLINKMRTTPKETAFTTECDELVSIITNASNLELNPADREKLNKALPLLNSAKVTADLAQARIILADVVETCFADLGRSESKKTVTEAAKTEIKAENNKEEELPIGKPADINVPTPPKKEEFVGRFPESVGELIEEARTIAAAFTKDLNSDNIPEADERNYLNEILTRLSNAPLSREDKERVAKAKQLLGMAEAAALPDKATGKISDAATAGMYLQQVALEIENLGKRPESTIKVDPLKQEERTVGGQSEGRPYTLKVLIEETKQKAEAVQRAITENKPLESSAKVLQEILAKVGEAPLPPEDRVKATNAKLNVEMALADPARMKGYLQSALKDLEGFGTRSQTAATKKGGSAEPRVEKLVEQKMEKREGFYGFRQLQAEVVLDVGNLRKALHSDASQEKVEGLAITLNEMLARAREAPLEEKDRQRVAAAKSALEKALNEKNKVSKDSLLRKAVQEMRGYAEAAQKDWTTGELTKEFLAFQDLDFKDDDAKKQFLLDTLASEAGGKYAQSLKELFAAHGEMEVEELAQELQEKCVEIIERSGLTASISYKSPSWAYWDLAKQFYFFTHKSEASPDYVIADPYESPGKHDEIIDRQLGFELFKARDKSFLAKYTKVPGYEKLHALIEENPPIKENGNLRSKDYARVGQLMRLLMQAKI